LAEHLEGIWGGGATGASAIVAVREGVCYNGRMNIPIKITKVGNSAAIILSKEVLAQLHADIGDTLHLSQSPDGWRITPYDAEFEKQMALAEVIMRENRDVLRALAK
jgi:putative addiction module antidote